MRYFSSSFFNNSNVSCQCENTPLSVLEIENIFIITVKCASNQHVLSTSTLLFPMIAYLSLVNIGIVLSCIIGIVLSCIIMISMHCSC